VFLAEYAGLSVTQQQELRRALRANGAEFKVVKMTLAQLAADDLKIDSLDELLLGPTGLAFADGDPVGAAKALKDFSKDHEVFVVKGGLLGLEFLTPEKISELADIEPREVLLAKLAGAMQAPMATMAGLLAALPRNAASALQQLLEKKEAIQGVEAVEEAVVEAVVEEEVVEEVEGAVAEAAAEADAASDDASSDDTEAEVDEADAPEAEADTSEPADGTDAAAADAGAVEAVETEDDSDATEKASADAEVAGADAAADTEDDDSSADAEVEEK